MSCRCVSRQQREQSSILEVDRTLSTPYAAHHMNGLAERSDGYETGSEWK
jgi:hypothetical protein